MKPLYRYFAQAVAVGAFLSVALGGRADDAASVASGAETPEQENTQAASQRAPDNTGKNRRDGQVGEPTAEQQKNNRTDLELTRQIRRSLMSDKSLSLYAHNVKIITQDGTVTLKGPVRSADEKKTVERKAAEVAGDAHVKSQIEIAAN